jgi:uncharacterized Zn-binding protein involved in type VI secretion
MAQPAAKQGDKITATDTHIVLVPSASGEVPTPTSMPFNGTLNRRLSNNVNIMGRAAAIVGSTATNTPSHTAPEGRFQREPSNQGAITEGSRTVFINGKPAARNGDTAITCNDPADLPVGKVVATGSVMIG